MNRVVASVRSFRLVVLAAIYLSAAGCLSPTLPLPPPHAEVNPPDTDGMVFVTGKALEQAYVACLNEDLEKGVITRSDSDGFYSLEVEGRVGDQLTLWQIRGTEHSQFTYLEVPPPP